MSQANINIDFVFGNRQILLNALTDEILDLKETSSSHRGRLNYLTRLSVHPHDVASVLIDSRDPEEIEKVSFQRMKYRNADIRAKKEIQAQALRAYLEDFIGPEQDDDSVVEVMKVTPVREPVRVEAVVDSEWSRLTGNQQLSQLSQEYGTLLKPNSNSIKPTFISIPFKPIVWSKTGPVTTSQSLVQEVKSSRRIKSADVRINIGSIPTASSPLDSRQLGVRFSHPEVSVLDLLRSISLFSLVSTSDLEELLTQSRVLPFRDGDAILQAKHVSADVFVVVEGTVVLQCGADGESPVPGTVPSSWDLTVGDYFGASVFSLESPALHDYLSAGPVLLLAVPAELLSEVLRHYESLDEEGVAMRAPFYLECEVPHVSIQPLYHFAEHALDALHALERAYAPTSSALLRAASHNQLTNGHSTSAINDRRKSRRRSYMLTEDEAAGTSALDAIAAANTQAALSIAHTNVEARRILLLSFLSLCSPRIDSETGGLEDMLALVEEFLGVDRARYFEVNRNRHVLLAKSMTSKTTQAVVELPLVGVTGFVAKNACLMNISNVDSSEMFDRSLDDVPGHRTKEMLCVPTLCMHGATSTRIDGVLQLLNTLDGRPFSKRDEVVSSLVAVLLGSAMQSKHSWSKLADAISTRSMTTNKLKLRVNSVALSSPVPAASITCTVMYAVNQNSEPAMTKPFPVTANRLGGGTDVPLYECILAGANIELPGATVSSLCVSARLLVEVFNRAGHPVGWSMIPLIASDMTLVLGSHFYSLTEGAFTGSMFMPCSSELSSAELPKATSRGQSYIHLTFPVFDGHSVLYSRSIGSGLGMVHRHGLPADLESKPMDWYLSRLSVTERQRFETICRYGLLDPVAPVLSREDKRMIWAMRFAMLSTFSLLPVMLLSVDWVNPAVVDEAYHLMHTWQPPDLMQILQMLGSSFADPYIRAFAAQKLMDIEDDELGSFVPCLCKLLRYETVADSALSRILLVRGLQNVVEVGIPVVRSLLSMPITEVNRHLLCLLHRFLPTSVRLSLGLQYSTLSRLTSAGGAYDQALKLKPHPENRLGAIAAFQQALEVVDANLPMRFTLPVCVGSKPLAGLHVGSSGPADSRASSEFLLRFVHGDTATADSDSRSEVRGSELTSVLMKPHCGIDWHVELSARQVVVICNKMWGMAGVNVRCREDLCVITPEGAGFRHQHPASRTLAQISAAVMAANAPARDSSRAVKEGSKDFRMDRGTGIEVLDGFMFAGSKYHSELLVRWLAVCGTTIESVAAEFSKSLAAFVVFNFVFNVERFTGETIALSPLGEIFPTNYSSSFLRLLFPTSSKLFSGSSNTPWETRKVSGIGLLPCFAVLLGMPGSALFRKFEDHLTHAFLVLRKQHVLLSALVTLSLTGVRKAGLIDDQAVTSRLSDMRQNLLLSLNDEEAGTAIQKLMYSSLRLQLSL